MKEPLTKHYPDVAQSFGIAGIVVLGMLFLLPVNFLLDKLVSKEVTVLVYYILAIGLPFLLIYFIRKRKTGNASFNLVLTNKRIIPFIAVGTIALLYGVVSPIASLIPMPEFIRQVFMELVSYSGVATFILMVIAAPILEELIFRGVILDGLIKKYSPLKSILISSLLFGLVHLNPWQFVTGFVIGIFAGWVYYHTRSLLPAIIIHATANLSGFISRFFIDSKSPMSGSLVEQYGGVTNLALTIIASVLIITGCIYYLKKEFVKNDNTEALSFATVPVTVSDL